MNPVLLTLMTSVLGHGLTISTFTGMIRAQGTPRLPLHSDNQFMPAPFSDWQHGATAVWYLDTPEELRIHRLIERHVRYGRTPEAARDRAKNFLGRSCC